MPKQINSLVFLLRCWPMFSSLFVRPGIPVVRVYCNSLVSSIWRVMCAAWGGGEAHARFHDIINLSRWLDHQVKEGLSCILTNWPIVRAIVAWAGSGRAIRCFASPSVCFCHHASHVMLLCRYNTIKMTEEILRSRPQMGNHGVLHTRIDALYAPNAHREIVELTSLVEVFSECIATKRSIVQGHCDEVGVRDRERERVEWTEQLVICMKQSVECLQTDDIRRGGDAFFTVATQKQLLSAKMSLCWAAKTVAHLVNGQEWHWSRDIYQF